MPSSCSASEVLPGLRTQDGFEGVLVLTATEGQGMIVTLWSSEDAAADRSGFAASELSRFATLFRSPPGREYYRVSIVDLPVGSGA